MEKASRGDGAAAEVDAPRPQTADNAIGRLNELEQRGNLETKFEVTKTGSDHQPAFNAKVTCKIAADDGFAQTISAEATAASKKEAKQEAARALLRNPTIAALA